MKFWAIASAAGMVVCPGALADTFWNEVTQGDLSGDRMNPTMFTLGEGTHSLLGHTAGGDLDYMAITLAPGMQLRQIILVSYESGDGVAFIGVQPGFYRTADGHCRGQ